MPAGTSHQALYRRWRAQTFSQMVGQDAVVATLRNAVATDQVSHALLFTGPRGTGKTSLARIVAKALNCTDLGPTADPCDACPSCVAIREGNALDVVEIDAASNRGINEIRELRERLAYAPAQLRRKVYILDEAHQITKDAWNALLKSLEEPPEFVTFMFASTHPQEFPPAILSRLQRFDVRRLTVPEISGKLSRILEADGREADPDAVELVARLAAGGMRDAESILDQLLSSTGGRIEADAVRDLLGLADADLVGAFVAALAASDAATGITLLDRLEERGRDLRIFLDQVVDAMRERLVAGLAAGRPDHELAIAARRLAAIDPTRLGPGGLRLQLELALFESPAGVVPGASARVPAAAPPAPAQARPAAGPRGVAGDVRPVDGNATDRAGAGDVRLVEPDAMDRAAAANDRPVGGRSPVASPATPDRPARGAATGAPPAVAPAVEREPAARAPERAPVAAGPDGAAPGGDLERLRIGWSAITGTASPALRAIIVECRPVSVDGASITLGFPEEKPFMRSHAERARAKLEAHLGSFLGRDVSVKCVVSNLDLLPPLPADADDARILEEAQRIFADDLAEVREVT